MVSPVNSSALAPAPAPLSLWGLAMHAHPLEPAIRVPPPPPHLCTHQLRPPTPLPQPYNCMDPGHTPAIPLPYPCHTPAIPLPYPCHTPAIPLSVLYPCCIAFPTAIPLPLPLHNIFVKEHRPPTTGYPLTVGYSSTAVSYPPTAVGCPSDTLQLFASIFKQATGPPEAFSKYNAGKRPALPHSCHTRRHATSLPQHSLPYFCHIPLSIQMRRAGDRRSAQYVTQSSAVYPSARCSS